MTEFNDIVRGASELDPSMINDLPMDPVAARAAQLAAAAKPGNPPVVEPAAPEPPAAEPERPATDPAFDSLMGVPDAPAAPPAAPDAPPAAPPAGNESVPLSRLNEVLEQSREDRQRIAILEKMILEGRTPPSPAAAPEPAADDPNIDPQLEGYFGPYIDKALRERGVLRSEFDGFRQTLQPVAQQQEVAQLGTVFAKVIPGFDPSNAGKVVERLNGITDPQEQALYAGSAVGAVALAQRMMLEGAFAGSGAPKPIPPRGPVRPGADIAGTPSRSEPVTDENMARRLAELPQADFDRLLQRQLGHSGQADFTLEDLLPRS